MNETQTMVFLNWNVNDSANGNCARPQPPTAPAAASNTLTKISKTDLNGLWQEGTKICLGISSEQRSVILRCLYMK